MLAISGLLAVPALAGATDITVNDDALGSGPAGANCAAPDFATIPNAIAAAAPSGDRVLVCAGTYVQNQVLIDKSIDLIGAGPGQSVIDGGGATGLPSSGLIRTNDNTNGDVLVQGFTVQNPGQVGTGATTPRMAILPKGNDLGTTQDFNDLEIVGRGVGGRDYGLDADNTDPDVILRNSSIAGTEFNPILIEQVDGSVTIRDNTIAPNGNVSVSTIFAFVYSNDSTTNPVRILHNGIDAQGRSGVVVQTAFPQAGITAGGTLDSVEVRGNTIEDFSTIGISISDLDGSASGLAGEIANVSVEDNTLRSNGAAGTTGVRIQGRVRNVGVRSNTLTGLGTGVLFANAPAGHGPVGAHVAFNRIAGNTIAGLTSNAAEPIEAEHNWWGCNEGPGQPGCDLVTGTGSVDYDPWLALGLAASPTAIETGGDTSRLTADLLSDSNGDAVEGAFPPGTPIGFATTLGSVTTPVGTEDGLATSTLSSGSQEGTADVTATLDGESVGAQVAIADPPPAAPDTTIDAGPAEGSSTTDTTPTFEFSSDDPAATFECRYDAGTWSACSGPGATHTPAAALAVGIHVFEVRAVDAALNPDPSPAGRTFLVSDTDPRENPGKGSPELDLIVTPRSVMLEPGDSVTYEATAKNSGASDASGVVVCARVPGRLELKGERCRRAKSVAAGASLAERFKVAVPDDSPARLYRVKFTVRVPGIGRDDRARARIRIPD